MNGAPQPVLRASAWVSLPAVVRTAILLVGSTLTFVPHRGHIPAGFLVDRRTVRRRRATTRYFAVRCPGDWYGGLVGGHPLPQAAFDGHGHGWNITSEVKQRQQGTCCPVSEVRRCGRS